MTITTELHNELHNEIPTVYTKEQATKFLKDYLQTVSKASLIRRRSALLNTKDFYNLNEKLAIEAYILVQANIPPDIKDAIYNNLFAELTHIKSAEFILNTCYELNILDKHTNHINTKGSK